MDTKKLHEQFQMYFGKCKREFFIGKGWRTLISAALITLLLMLVTGKELFLATNQSATKTGAYALVCACIWIGLFNSIQSICKERAVVKTEYSEGMIPLAYILAHAAFDAIVCGAETVVVTLIVFARYYSNTRGFFCCIGLFLTFFLIIFASDLMGLAVSALVRKPDQAMTVMPFILIIQLIFAGEMFELNSITKVLANFTVSKWGWESILTLCDIEGRSIIELLRLSRDVTYAGYFYGWLMLILIGSVCGLLASQFIKLTRFDKRG